MRSIFGAAAALVFAAPALLAGDVVELTSGARVEGKVLKQDEERVIVDLGAAVLTLNRKDVARVAASDKADPPEKKDPLASKEDAEGLFSTADLKPGSIKEKAEVFGPGVVLVTTPAGLGSGFFITDRGHAITNAHVIEGETKISVTVFEKGKDGFEKKKWDKVEILAVNAFYDLALLQVKADKDVKFTKCCVGDSAELKNGDPVFVIGNPLGMDRSVSQGIVSSRNRNYGGHGLTYVQTTAAINPGNSGGPMFNLKGEVIGVTNMKLFGVIVEGMGFAIPSARVKEFLTNRDAFAYDKDNPNTGYRYLPPPGKKGDGKEAGEKGRQEKN